MYQTFSEAISLIASVLSIATFFLALFINRKISSAVDKTELINNIEQICATLSGYIKIFEIRAESLNSLELLNTLIELQERYTKAYSKKTTCLFKETRKLAKDYKTQNKTELSEKVSALKANIEKDAKKTW